MSKSGRPTRKLIIVSYYWSSYENHDPFS